MFCGGTFCGETFSGELFYIGGAICVGLHNVHGALITVMPMMVLTLGCADLHDCDVIQNSVTEL
jgi:hypothetical protein